MGTMRKCLRGTWLRLATPSIDTSVDKASVRSCENRVALWHGLTGFGHAKSTRFAAAHLSAANEAAREHSPVAPTTQDIRCALSEFAMLQIRGSWESLPQARAHSVCLWRRAAA